MIERRKEEKKMTLDKIKIGFLGFGNMAQAMAQGWIRPGNLKPDSLYATARNLEKLRNNTEALGIHAVDSTKEMIQEVDIVVLAVKPYQIQSVVEPIKDLLKDKIIFSVAANFTFDMFQEFLSDEYSHVSSVPNTPVSIGEGIIVVEEKHSLSNKEWKTLEEALQMLGLVQQVPTEQMSIAGTLAGCGPAFASLFLEALADGAVKYGLSRADAYALASQMISGTGKMYLETHEHPGVMKDKVTSPGGTTIKGVAALEEHGFRNAVIQAFDAIEGKQIK